MDLNELFKDVTSFNKEAAMKENMRMGELKDSVTAQAFRDAQRKLASHINIIKIDSPESNLTEFSRNKLSGKMKAMLSVSTTAGLKRLPIHFVVKASVPTMVETPEQVVAALDNVEGSIDKEVKEILEKQKQMSAYHNEDAEEIDEKKAGDLNFGTGSTQITDDSLKPEKYVVNLWPGSGYATVPFTVGALSEEDALYYVVQYLVENNMTQYYLTEDDVQSMANSEGMDIDDFKEQPAFTEKYMYMSDFQVYLLTENMKITKSASSNSNIKVQAKKKEIDLGVRENTYAEQFPVKLLVYPKTYLPELKKGDILNVGGFKYRYIGDEPTISGDTENGINARFELVVNTKKASLNVTAADDTQKSDRSEKTRQGIEQAKKDTAEYEEAQEYLKGLTPEDIENMSEDELALTAIQCRDYGVTKPTALTKALAAHPNALLKFLSIPDISLFNIDEEATPAMLKVIEDSPKNALEILKTHKNEVEKAQNFDGLPEFIKKPLKSDLGVQIEIAKTMPNIFDEEMANNIKNGSETEAVSIGLGIATNSKNPAYKILNDFAKENDYSNQTATNEEIGVEDGPVDGESFHTPTEEEINRDFQELWEESRGNNNPKKEDEEGLQDNDLGDLGEGVSDAIKEEEQRQQQENEDGDKEDILDDNQEAPKDDDKDVKKKTESEPVIEKDAATTEDLSFRASLNQDKFVDFTAGEDEKIQLFKNKYSELKDIPNDWITIKDEKWSGYIEWAVDMDAREWGLSSFSIVCKPTKVTYSANLEYFPNSESADLGESTDDWFEVEIDLTKIDTQVESVLNEGSQLLMQKIEIGLDNTALAYF